MPLLVAVLLLGCGRARCVGCDGGMGGDGPDHDAIDVSDFSDEIADIDDGTVDADESLSDVPPDIEGDSSEEEPSELDADPPDEVDADLQEIDATEGELPSDDDVVAEEDEELPPLPARCLPPESARITTAALPEGFQAHLWATGLSGPRGMVVDAAGDVLVIERNVGGITVLWDADGDCLSGAHERLRLVEGQRLNHGLALHGGFVYASSDTEVFRWPYIDGMRTPLAARQRVVHSIPGGGHTTRTLIFDDQGRLYVSVGSAGNVDLDSSRSRIRRFTAVQVAAGEVPFAAGEVFADGLRNEVGLAFDAQGRLWGVENGMDNLRRDDLGGDIHEDNPAEELNLFAEPGLFYGYPYCFSEFRLPPGVGGGPGTQWVVPQFRTASRDDAWCRDPTKVVPPMLAMQAHSAPLGIVFPINPYPAGWPRWRPALPEAWINDAIIGFHGSWNRDTPTGYKVVRVPFANGRPVGDPVPLLEYGGAGDIGRNWPHRPVESRFARDGALLVTSDASGVVMRIDRPETPAKRP